jgi:hypothetical protein
MAMRPFPVRVIGWLVNTSNHHKTVAERGLRKIRGRMCFLRLYVPDCSEGNSSRGLDLSYSSGK